MAPSEELPLPVFGDTEYPEETRLTYRFLDLRRDTMHQNMMLRSNVVRWLRNAMWDQGFTEFQTPIITASSAPKARATFWCRRGCIRASSTRCRRRRSSSSS